MPRPVQGPQQADASLPLLMKLAHRGVDGELFVHKRKVIAYGLTNGVLPAKGGFLDRVVRWFPTKAKQEHDLLREKCVRYLQEACGLDEERARGALKVAGFDEVRTVTLGVLKRAEQYINALRSQRPLHDLKRIGGLDGELHVDSDGRPFLGEDGPVVRRGQASLAHNRLMVKIHEEVHKESDLHRKEVQQKALQGIEKAKKVTLRQFREASDHVEKLQNDTRAEIEPALQYLEKFPFDRCNDYHRWQLHRDLLVDHARIDAREAKAGQRHQEIVTYLKGLSDEEARRLFASVGETCRLGNELIAGLGKKVRRLDQEDGFAKIAQFFDSDNVRKHDWVGRSGRRLASTLSRFVYNVVETASSAACGNKVGLDHVDRSLTMAIGRLMSELSPDEAGEIFNAAMAEDGSGRSLLVGAKANLTRQEMEASSRCLDGTPLPAKYLDDAVKLMLTELGRRAGLPGDKIKSALAPCIEVGQRIGGRDRGWVDSAANAYRIVLKRESSMLEPGLRKAKQ